MVKSAKALIFPLAVLLLVAAATAAAASAQSPGNGRYDTDGDGLIEISNLEQLNAIRADRNGNGTPDNEDLANLGTPPDIPGYGPALASLYSSAFPTSDGEAVCTGECLGYELQRSLDFNDAASYASGSVNTTWTEGEGFPPIVAFEAVLDGNGNTLSNLYINRSNTLERTGLFGFLWRPALIHGIGLVNAEIRGMGQHVGAFAGTNLGRISFCFVTGSVKGNFVAGGLVGLNYGEISRSHAGVNVSGDRHIGGLVGYNQSGSIDHSHSTGNVSGQTNIGGLVGLSAGYVLHSYATGNASGKEHIGGLAGLSSGFLFHSFATGHAAGETAVGGLVGLGQGSTLRNTYATGSASADGGGVGGLVGVNQGSINNSYATASASAGYGHPGGLVGENEGSVYDSYWNKGIVERGVGRGRPVQQGGKTAVELRQPTDYAGIYANWERYGDFWDFGASSQYPALKADINGDGAATWQEFGPQGRPRPSIPAVAPPPAVPPSAIPVPNGKYDTDGDGLIEINYLEQLDVMRFDHDGDGIPSKPGPWPSVSETFEAAYYAAFPITEGESVCATGCKGYELASSLDFRDPGSYASGAVNTAWSEDGQWPGNISLRTIFEGNYHTISNMHSGRGLFKVWGTGSVARLGLVDGVLSGVSFNGLLAIFNFGEISHSYVSGAVSGGDFIAGLAGENVGVIRDSYSTASVTADSQRGNFVGGLVAYNGMQSTPSTNSPKISIISHTCATGHVWVDPELRQTNDAGGLVAYNQGTVTHSCASGDVRGHTKVGGLVGGGVVSHSYATGNVTGVELVGGLVGEGAATHSYATGDVTGRGYFTGGLVGGAGAVRVSHASGNVTGIKVSLGYSRAGGLVGSSSIEVVASYSTGNVSNAILVGGLAGLAESVTASYSTARVFGGSYMGGLLGSAEEEAASGSYWNSDIFATGVGRGESTGAVGLTTTEMQLPTGYAGAYANWNLDLDNADGDGDPNTGTDDFWDFGTNTQYPALKADFDGDGVASATEFGGQGRTEAPPPTLPPTTPAAPTAPEPNGKYDTDGDGLIEVSNLEQLDAVRYDGDGNGRPDSSVRNEGRAAYAAAFPVGDGEKICDRLCVGFELTRSLDFRSPASYASGTVRADWISGQGWTSIGPRFTGVFDGSGHTISNLYINRDDGSSVGLFNRLLSGNIRDLGLPGVDVRASAYSLGGLAGTVSGRKPSIIRSYVTGSVSNSSAGGRVGGLVGQIHAYWPNIGDSYFTGLVAFQGQEARGDAGGLVGDYRVDYGTGSGYMGPGAIRRSHSSGTVSGRGSWCAAGGLVGSSDGDLVASHSSADVSCSESEIAGSAGGLVGYHSDGTIRSSYATGNVSGARDVGGLAGSSTGPITGSYATGDVSHEGPNNSDGGFGGLVGANMASITSSYATGSVTGNEPLGGLAGLGSSAASQLYGSTTSSIGLSYATGRVSRQDGASREYENVGGLLGVSYYDGLIYSSYWDTGTSGQSIGVGGFDPPGGAQGKSTAELQSPTGYTGIYEGWQYSDDGLWDFGTSAQYPALKADMNADGIATWQEFGSQRGNEPVPSGPAPEQPCQQQIEYDGAIAGIWGKDCVSVSSTGFRKGAYARYYTFTLEHGREVSISLESDADAYLYLLLGEGKNGQAIYRNDDYSTRDTTARIYQNLPAGSYTIEATTYHAEDVDTFELSVQGLADAPPEPEPVPGPEPEPVDPEEPCQEDLTADGPLNGQWTGNCASESRSGSYARYYLFTLSETREITAMLESTDADPYLYLLSGSGSAATEVASNDDFEGSRQKSRIQHTLTAGDYRLEATTYDAGAMGSFTLTVSGLDAGEEEPVKDPGDPGAGGSTSPDECLDDLGELDSATERTGSWVSDCASSTREGSYAQFFGFSLSEKTSVTIGLKSDSADTVLNLIEGTGSDGALIESNDDAESGNTNSRISRDLEAGSYTIEATTFDAGITGSFTLTVTPAEVIACVTNLGDMGEAIQRLSRFDSTCNSETREGSHARYYTFNLAQTATVTITLSAGEGQEGRVDTYLYLRAGQSRTGNAIQENDDHEGSTTLSRIQQPLEAGAYTVEATTYGPGQAGAFTLTIAQS